MNWHQRRCVAHICRRLSGRCHNVFFADAQVEAELKSGKDQSSFAKSTIVAASAPRELGSLRQADGAEGFENGTKA